MSEIPKDSAGAGRLRLGKVPPREPEPAMSRRTPIMSRRPARSVDGEPEAAVESSIGRRAKGTLALKVTEVARESVAEQARNLPTFEDMKPVSNELKKFAVAGIDIRQYSTKDHQDGVAFNPNTRTVVVSDGMGGIGPGSELKNFFGWGVAHAVAAKGDLASLSEPAGLKAVLSEVAPLLDQAGVDTTVRESGLVGSMWRGLSVGATIAAVEQVESQTWRALTYGDSSVLVVTQEGEIKAGYGEAYQLWQRDGSQMGKLADDAPLSSCVGLKEGTLEPEVIDNGRDGLRAQFEDFTVEPGDRIVVASDAYVQKSTMEQLIRDVNMPPESWAARYSDDTTLAIIDPTQLTG